MHDRDIFHPAAFRAVRPAAVATAAAAVAVLLLALGPAPARAQLFVDIEGGGVFSGYNSVRIPGDGGTKFSFDKELETDPGAYWRLRVGYRTGRHTFFAFGAPLTLKPTGSVDRDILFEGVTFPAGTPLDGVYTFNSWRVTWRYAVRPEGDFRADLGFTAKIRDAVISLDGGGLFAEKTNVGFVPLLHFRLRWRAFGSADLLLEGDALAAPQGRAEDVFLGLQTPVNWEFSPLRALGVECSRTLRFGYRVLEGGADVDEVYTFAALHFFGVGLTIDFGG
jgi:hypothetical protein